MPTCPPSAGSALAREGTRPGRVGPGSDDEMQRRLLGNELAGEDLEPDLGPSAQADRDASNRRVGARTGHGPSRPQRSGGQAASDPERTTRPALRTPLRSPAAAPGVQVAVSSHVGATGSAKDNSNVSAPEIPSEHERRFDSRRRFSGPHLPTAAAPAESNDAVDQAWPRTSGKWQATGCPWPRSTSSGASLAQRSVARQHRVRNGQPDGGDAGLGSSPCNTIRRRCRSTRGRPRARLTAGPRCRGGRAVRTTSGRGPTPRSGPGTSLPPGGRSADHRQIVGDEQVRQAESCRSVFSRSSTPAWTLTSSAETGSSRMTGLGIQGEGPSQSHPLALAARELVGVAVGGVRAQLYQAEKLVGPALSAAADVPVTPQRLGDRVDRRHPGIERRRRILEHDLHAAGAVRRSSSRSSSARPCPRSRTSPEVGSPGGARIGRRSTSRNRTRPPRRASRPWQGRRRCRQRPRSSPPLGAGPCPVRELLEQVANGAAAPRPHPGFVSGTVTGPRPTSGCRTSDLRPQPAPRPADRPTPPRPPAAGRRSSCGSRARRSEQRGWNAHPGGIRSGDGGVPAMPVARGRPRRRRGLAARRARRVRVVGASEQVLDRAPLHDHARVHHGHLVRAAGDDTEVVADQDHGHALLRGHRPEQVEDLGLHGTSRPVVGSSAIRTSGSLATAMAIITRWHMPPESSWGNARAVRCGWASPTRPAVPAPDRGRWPSSFPGGAPARSRRSGTRR